MLKNSWFYCAFGWFYRPSHRKCEYNIGFIDPATENVEKPLVLLQNQPQQRPATDRPTEPGSGLPILAWRYYEEPLQPRCLGKYEKHMTI